MLRALSLLVLLATVPIAGELHAQVPADNQALLVLRILAFDRKLAQRATGAVRIAVIFKEGSSDSESCKSDIEKALKTAGAKTSVSGMKVEVTTLRHNAGSFEADLTRSDSAAAYLCPGLDDALPAISKSSRATKVLTFSGVESFITSGASVGLVRRASKVGILVNLAASRAEGADLDSNLLQMAEVIR